MAPFPPPPLAPTPDTAEVELLPLVAVIELKWLAAGIGQHLHVDRMQHDAAYALGVLDAVDSASSAPLRRAAKRLREMLLRAMRPGGPTTI